MSGVLTEKDRQHIVRLLEAGNPLPAEYRDRLFDDDSPADTEAVLVPTDVAQKQATTELEERAQFMESIVSLSPGIIYIYDILKRCNIYSNDGVETILGYSAYEIKMMGENLIQTLMHPDDFEVYRSTIVPAYGTTPDKTAITHQYRMKSKAGEWVWLDSSEIVYKRLPDGSPSQILGVIHDVNESKQAEQETLEAKQEAEENETRFRNIFEKSSDAILIIENGSFNDCNLATVEMLEYKTKEDFLNVHPSVLSPEKQPDGRLSSEKAEEMMHLALANGTHRFEWMHSKSSGEVFPVEVLLTGISNEPGNQIIHCVWRDITERKQAEAGMKLAAAVYETALAATSAADIHGKITSANPSFVSTWGYASKREVIDKSVADFIENPEDANAILASLKSTGTWQGEFLARKKDGSTFIAESRATALLDENGKLEGFASSVLDITERKASERREKDLQEKLARSERLESLGVLAGGVAHDLNNSLGPLIALPQMILDDIHDLQLPPDETTKEVEECLSIVEKSAMRSAKVVKDLLHLSGSGQYSLEPFDLNAATCIQRKCSCAKNIRSSHSNINFACSLATEPVMIMADESHLNRAIGNLIHNAAESISEDGSVNIRTSVMQAKEQVGSFEDIPPGHYGVLEIEDTGCGVDKNDVNHLFEPFFSRKTKGDLSGSGLGLAVVHGIVKDHNSFIDVVSRVGEGTTFTLYFPLMSSFVAAPPVELEGAATPQGSGRILVVDDEKIQRFTISKNLKKLGYDASVASNGHEAVALFAEAEKAKSATPFDLVLLDMTMEVGFDGLDTYRAIRKLYPNQKVIISSGHAESKRIRAAMDLGAGCLPKPYQRCDLAEALRTTLGDG